MPPPPTGSPIVFGHYWRTGVPSVVNPLAVCVDYSLGAKGCDRRLAAYRWCGEQSLIADNFVSVNPI